MVLVNKSQRVLLRRKYVILLRREKGDQSMATYDERIAALEKDAATMKRDIIYKLDDTNSALTMIRGVAGSQGNDIKEIKNRVKVIDVHLDGIDTRLEGLKEEVRAIRDQQNGQGQAIKEIGRHLEAFEERVEERFTSLEQRFTSVEGTLTQILQRLPNPPTAE
jgi:chromosome segregation ATPase